jgi:tetratricopeptide (TPR) repeat protein
MGKKRHIDRILQVTRIFVGVISILAIQTSAASAQQSTQKSAQKSAQINDPVLEQNPVVSEAYKLFEAGDSAAALEHFQLALSENQDDLSAQLGQAMLYAEMEQHAEAFKSYDAIVQKYPRHAFAWNGRGLAAFNMEDFDAALISFKQATAERPVNGFFYESLAWTQMCRGEFTDAVASAKQATLMYNKTSESSAYPLLIAYFAYLESGDLRNAEYTLKYAALNKPQHSWPSPIIDYLTGLLSETELISYVTDSAQETEAHTYIGLKLREAGQTDQAKQHLEWVARHGDTRVFEHTLARALKMQDSVALLVP